MDEKNLTNSDILSEEDTTLKQKNVSVDDGETTAESLENSDDTSTNTDEIPDSDNNTDGGYVSQFGEIEGINNGGVSETKTVVRKKKRLIMPTVIVSAGILLATVVVAVVYLLFFDTSVVGTYIIEPETTGEEVTTQSEDQVKSYFIFKEDGTLIQRYGSYEYLGTYQTSSEDGQSKIYLSIPGNGVDVTYNYKIEGNKLTGAKLVWSDDIGNSVTLAPATYSEVEVEDIEDAKVDEGLVGKWEDTLGQGIVYTFNDDNTLIMSGESINIYCKYSASDGLITVKFVVDEVTETSMPYEIKDGVVYLNGVEFYEYTE